MMGHLQRDADGHLLKLADGHLMRECCCAYCQYTWWDRWSCPAQEWQGVEYIGHETTPKCVDHCATLDWTFDHQDGDYCYYKCVTCESGCSGFLDCWYQGNATPPPGPAFTPGVNDCPCGSANCSDCAENCDGAATIELVISGFTGACAGLNGTYTLAYQSACYWRESSSWTLVQCVNGVWEVATGNPNFGASNQSAVLNCAGDHPTGAGTLTGSGMTCYAQTGAFSID